MSFNWERSPIAGSPLSAVVPVSRPSAAITTLVEALAHELGTLGRAFEILLVDDAGDDGSASQLKTLAERLPHVRVLPHEKHQGEGAALRTGIQAAQHPLLLTLPADGSFQPVVLQQLLGQIDEVDIVIGVRQGLSWWARFAQSWRGKLGLGVRVSDPASPLRLYRRSIFERLPIQSNGSFVHQEILAKATVLECIMTEVEINWEAKASTATESGMGADFWRVMRRPAFGSTK